MTERSWVHEALGAEAITAATRDAERRRVRRALGAAVHASLPDERLRWIVHGLELPVFQELESDDVTALRAAATEAFQIARALPLPEEPLDAGVWLLRIGCLGVLGDRGADVRRILTEGGIPALPLDSPQWGERVWATLVDLWLRLLRKDGWNDFDLVLARVVSLRQEQEKYEPGYLDALGGSDAVGAALGLISGYHLAKAGELLGTYLTQGSLDGRHDIRQQLEAQFDPAVAVAEKAGLIERSLFARLLARTSLSLVESSIWNVTRAVNSRVTRFVHTLVDRGRRRPIFEVLPPQRRTLREEGLLGTARRSVVVSLPTSSGKTFIAEFRILQALNQFDSERGWVAYVAPTRALVNQLALRLRRDFDEIGVVVEKVSPALEVDGLESEMLSEADDGKRFRVLLTTPEKLDLMLRGGWEKKIGRPLTLVVVDEAHGIASSTRGLKLELLLATINRECRYAQFLLLTPFVPNAKDVARWLDPGSHQGIDLGVDWSPNDRVIALARVRARPARGDFGVNLIVRHTTRNTLDGGDVIPLDAPRPLGLSRSEVAGSSGKLAAATAQLLKGRGTVIVLVDTPRSSWGVARVFEVEENRVGAADEDVAHAQRFFVEEMGAGFPLVSLLEHGVGVHHAGLSDDTRTIVEWLAERSKLSVLVATTTLAQGVNFPVSAVVFASHQYRLKQPPFREDMPPEDFWNIAGRAGRVDQGDLGVIALAAHDDARAATLDAWLGRSVGALNSTLIEMMKKVMEAGQLPGLESLSWKPQWSAFVQYLAHTYRQMDDHDRFASEVEQVLRGTLGFQELRKSHRGWADSLVRGVRSYAERLRGGPLALVDATGFSLESVTNTLVRIGRAGITREVWSPELFTTRRRDLQRLMGVLLEVPELREQLGDVVGGDHSDGDKLSRIVCDWVQGRPLPEMAAAYFSTREGDDADDVGANDEVAAMTRCCQKVFGRLTHTASWGLGALQSLTLGDAMDSLSAGDQRVLRNLPARVYYGVNSDEAVALRLLGVPRMAAVPLARVLEVGATQPLSDVRGRLRTSTAADWKAALGDRGETYRRVWSIIEGNG